MDEKRSLPFVYVPLDDPSADTRTVKLMSSKSDADPICLSIKNIKNLSIGKKAGTFEALSYTWGGRSEKTLIFINNRSFKVGWNLFNALRSLRHTGDSTTYRSRMLWIDAICINQKDSAEVNVQVRRMDVIYKQASQVIVWLGNYFESEDRSVLFPDYWGLTSLESGSLETTQEAFQLMKYIAQCRREGNVEKCLEDYDGRRVNHIGVWGRMCALLNRSRFSRLWVFQELNVARNAVFVCGRCTLSNDELLLVGAALKDIFFLPKTASLSVQSLKRDLFGAYIVYSAAEKMDIFRQESEFANLIVLAWVTRKLQCFNPRDKLMALLGIMPLPDRDDINAYYSEFTTLDFYADWASKRISRTQCLDIFSACTDSGRDGSRSWVPRFEAEWEPEETLFRQTHQHWYSYGAQYSASGNSAAQIYWRSDDGRRVSLTGYQMDQIVAISRPSIRTQSTLEQLRSWEEIFVQCLETEPAPGSPFYKAFTDVLFRGQKESSRHLHTFQERYAVWRGYEVLPSQWNSEKSEEERRASFLESIEFRVASSMVSQLFITSKGYLGAVNKDCNVVVGDSVYILCGGNTPFVLRQTLPREYYENKGDFPAYLWGPNNYGGLDKDGTYIGLKDVDENCLRSHRLMGPCYLNSWMDGEAMSF